MSYKFPIDCEEQIVEITFLDDMAWVSGAIGGVDAEMIKLIEKDFSENMFDGLDRGDGIYLFKASWDNGQFGDWWRCELPPHWELDFIDFRPINTNRKKEKV